MHARFCREARRGEARLSHILHKLKFEYLEDRIRMQDPEFIFFISFSFFWKNRDAIAILYLKKKRKQSQL